MSKIYRVETLVKLDDQHDGQKIIQMTNITDGSTKFGFEAPVPTPQGMQMATILIDNATSIDDAFAKLEAAQTKHLEEVESFIRKMKLTQGIQGVNPNALKISE